MDVNLGYNCLNTSLEVPHSFFITSMIINNSFNDFIGKDNFFVECEGIKDFRDKVFVTNFKFIFCLEALCMNYLHSVFKDPIHFRFIIIGEDEESL